MSLWALWWLERAATWREELAEFAAVPLEAGGFHGHGGTPSSLDVFFFFGNSHRSKWMMMDGVLQLGNVGQHRPWMSQVKSL